MAIAGARKAALFLMGLEAATAGELLKAARPDLQSEIAAELAYLEASGQKKASAPELIQEFADMLQKQRRSKRGKFLQEMLQRAVGPEKAKQLLSQTPELLQARDPFGEIRSRPAADLARAMEGESAQVAAMVLAELPPRKSAELLLLLEETVRTGAVRCMTAGRDAPIGVRLRVAASVRKRLEAPAPAAAMAVQKQDQSLRKVAVLLRSLAAEARAPLLKTLEEQAAETAQTVQRLMVTWEDLPVVADRSLQEVLRGVSSKTLALAMIEAQAGVANKIRSNISERARAMLEEETSLLKDPTPKDIEAAREEMLEIMRKANAEGNLAFEETSG